MYPFQEEDFRFDTGRHPVAGVVLSDVTAQLELLQVAVFLFDPPDGGAEGRVGEDEVELAGCEAGMLVLQVTGKVQGVVAHDVGVAIIVDDHVHLGDSGQLVVHLNAIHIVLCEVVPILEVLHCVGLVPLVCLSAHVV